MASFALIGFNFTKLAAALKRPPTTWSKFLLPSSFVSWNQERNYAARRGTRLKQMRLKKSRPKEEEVKKTYVPHKLLQKQTIQKKIKKRSEKGRNLLDSPCDNVYCIRHYKRIKYKLEDAIEMHRETHHPTIFNEPNALVYAYLELNLKLQKKNRLLDVFSSLIRLPHDFELNAPRQVLAICSRPEEQEQARKAGANIIGSTELISMIQSGDLPTDDFQFVVSTPELMNTLVPIRGILKTKFPSKSKGTITLEIGKAVDRLVNGIEYKSKVDPNEKEYGSVEVPIGRLPMDPKLLEENLDVLIKDVCSRKDPESGPFVTMLFITSPPSREKFIVPHEKFMPIIELEEEI